MPHAWRLKPLRNTPLYHQFICSGVGLLLAMVSLELRAESPAGDYDWVPLEELTEAQKNRVKGACRGVYLDPLANYGRENLAETPLDVAADRVDMTATRIELEGDVAISQGDRRLHADYMYFNRSTDQAELRDGVEIRQPGILVRGTGAAVNMAGREAVFKGGEFVLHDDHMRGEAGHIDHSADGVITLQDGRLTSCEPGHEAWQIKGGQLRVDPNTKQGSGRNVVIELGGIPIIYVPYLSFPVGEERKSGLLIPAVGTSEGGLDITIPWYWNIAPNQDAIFAPRYSHGHGAMMETEWRYLNRVSHNALNLAWLPDDRGGGDPDVDKLIADGADEALLRPYKGEDRWLAQLEHEGGDNSRWYSDVNYAKVSDVDYFRDIAPESFDIANNTFLHQSAQLGYRLPNWDINARVQAYQNLLIDLDDNYRQLPRVQMNGRYIKSKWGMTFNHEWVNFSHSDESYITGQRANIDYQLEWNGQWQWGTFRPQLGVQGLAYSLDGDNLRDGADTSPLLHAPYAALDASLIFERQGGRHTLEPKIFYLYRDHANHTPLYQITDPEQGEPRDVNFDTTPLTFSYDQMFRARRFAGGDRLGDANQLTIGLTSQWMDKQGISPLASVSLGQVIYFRNQEVSLRYNDEIQAIEESDLATQVRARLSDNFLVRGDFLYNPKEERVMRATTGVEYQDDQLRRIKFGYRFVREDQIQQSTLSVDQLDTAFSLPFRSQWQIVGRLFYDLDENKELDAFLGFEYDDCCYRLRLLARRWLDSKLATLVNDERRHYDDGLFLEIDLKGLASSGDRIQRLLAETIPGFRER